MLLLALLLCCAAPDGGGGGSPTTPTQADPCGTGTWGEVQGTVFVDAGADAGARAEGGGDGSQDAPFATIGAAVEAAGDGDVIAIAAGDYAETLRLADRDLTLAGRCADLVTLDGGGIADLPLVGFNWEEGGTGTLVLSGLTLAAAEEAGLAAGGGVVEVRDVVVRDARLHGIRLQGTAATLEDVRIVDGTVRDVFGGGALTVTSGSQVTARRLVIEGQRGGGVSIGGEGTVLELEESELVDGLGFDDTYGVPVVATGGTLRLRQVRVADSAVSAGLIAQHPAEVEVDGLIMEDLVGLLPCPDQGCTPAVLATILYSFGGEDEAGGRITGSGVRITGCDNGVWALDGGEIELTDLVLSDLGEDLGLGGMVAARAGRIEASEVSIERARGVAVLAAQGGEIALRDVEILDTQPGGGVVADGATAELLGAHVQATGDSVLSLEGARLAGVQGTGLYIGVDETGTPEVSLQDVVIEDVSLASSVRTALGVVLIGGSLVAEGLSVRDVAGPGIVSTLSDEVSGSLQCTDCDIEAVALAGAVVIGSATERTMRFDGCTIADVAVDASAGLSAGFLAAENTGAPALEVTGCEVSGTAHGALLVAGQGAIQVRDSTLHGGSGATLAGIEVHGNAVYATGIGPWDGETGLLVEDSTLVPGAGETVLLHAASATLEGNSWEGGTLRQQHCDGVEPVVGGEEAPALLECPDTDVLVVDVDPRSVGRPPTAVFE